MSPRIFLSRIDKEWFLRIHIIVMAPSTQSRVGERKQGSLMTRIASLTAYEKIAPAICQPVISRILSILALPLLQESLRPEVLYRSVRSGSELRLTVAAFVVLGLKQCGFYGWVTIDATIKIERLGPGAIVIRLPIIGFAILLCFTLATVLKDFRRLRWAFNPNHGRCEPLSLRLAATLRIRSIAAWSSASSAVGSWSSFSSNKLSRSSSD